MLPLRLAHLHIPHTISYAYSLRLQEALLQKHFAYNTHVLQSLKSKTPSPKSDLTRPPPTLLTFQTDPTYTVGRRHLKSNPLSPSQIDFLTTNSSSPTAAPSENTTKLATFYPSPRGGLLTYHAPGQLTAYVIVNLRHHAITPRCFIRLLENTIIRTCAKHGVPNTLTTDDPGVWIGEKTPEDDNLGKTEDETCGGNTHQKAASRKICAIGVQVTRGVTSHGLGLNLRDAPIIPSTFSHLYTLPAEAQEAPQTAPGYLSWGFGRITACGLEGKSVTWMAEEGASDSLRLEAVAQSLAEELCSSLTKQGKIELEGVDVVDEDDVLSNQTQTSPSEDQ